MKNFGQVVLLLLVSVLLFACTTLAPDKHNSEPLVDAAVLNKMRLQTAGFISGYTEPSQVFISGLEKNGPTEFKWKADVPTGSYECISDEMVRRVFCAQRR